MKRNTTKLLKFLNGSCILSFALHLWTILMLKKLNFMFTILNIIIIGIFWYRFASPICISTASFFNQTDHIGNFLAAQANHYSLLQIYLILFSILIGAGAFWGYAEIKKVVEKKTDDKINEIVPKFVMEYLQKNGQEVLNQVLVKIKMSQASSCQTSNDNFSKNVENMRDDPNE